MKSIDDKIVSMIYGHGRGFVFTPKLFSSLGDPRVVGTALTRLSRKGTIRRLARGLYDYPRKHRDLGLLTPSIDDVANTLKGRDAIRLQPSGAYAANLLGLSSHVPMKVVFLTDGPSKSIKLGKMEIALKRTTPRNMATAGRISGIVIQALKHLGQKNLDDSVLQLLRQRLGDADKRQLQKDLQYAPAWIAKVMRAIAAGDGE
ncbi:MAG: hypothetical protein JXA41_12890 [Deltaproteobacteria bacterium]|nr:hypothetical protein [Deltaproteobacteria bacterium]